MARTNVLESHAVRVRASRSRPRQQSVQPLEVGQPVERELSGGDTHLYFIRAAAGQYLRATLEQRGIDVVLALFRPDGVRVREVDSPNGKEGPEPLFHVTEMAGDYRLQIKSLDVVAAPGRYQIRLEELRPEREQDKSRVEAENVRLAASLLLVDGTTEAAAKALTRYEEARRLFRAIGERKEEALTLSRMGGGGAQPAGAGRHAL
jgi:hypothetical protein